MPHVERKAHWERVYTTKQPTEVSWYQAEPTRSLALLREFAAGPDPTIVDIGGGDSTFVDAVDLARHVAAKGKVEPGRWRAYGYEAPGHRWADVKLAWRSARMRVGRAPAGSSPRAQEELGLNDDAVLRATRSDGERLRE